ncbi:hypothetical protein [Thiomicrorhabdus sp.]|uniref:hypothetical protein n=1 Tax=Thiomicrorhabdus sp. TaxID=2039724 RepID=UPI0029C962C0|nr:hypothetical protein [Thiomicrorhabdus sp.]
MRKIVLIIASLTILSGCIGTPSKSTPKKIVSYTAKDTIEIILPTLETSTEATPKNYIDSLKGSSKHWVGWAVRGETKFWGDWIFGENHFEYSTGGCGWVLSGRCNPMRKGLVKINGELSIKVDGSNTTVKLLPKTYSEESTTNFLTGGPHFDSNSNLDSDISDLISMLRKLSYQFEFDINSEYSTDSVSSNFARLLKSGGSYNDDNLKKTYKNTYILKTNSGTHAKVAVSTFPYRNGSKAVITVWLTPVVTGNILNYAAAKKEIEERVKEIVNA